MKTKIMLMSATVLCVAHLATADEIHWGGGNDVSWKDGSSWDGGVKPGASDTAVFDASDSLLIVKMNDNETISNLVVSTGAKIQLQKANSADGGRDVSLQEASGDGELKLYRAGFKPVYGEGSEVVFNVDAVKIVTPDDTSKDSWFDGLSTEGKRFVVNSAISGSGKMKCKNNVTLTGEVTLAGELIFEGSPTVENYIYDGAGFDFNGGSGNGVVEKATVRSGTFVYAGSDMETYKSKITAFAVEGGTLDATGCTDGRTFMLAGGFLEIGSGTTAVIDASQSGKRVVINGTFATASDVAWPANVSFAEGSDLSKVEVYANVGDCEKVLFDISSSGGTYTLTERSGFVYWTGKGGDAKWATSGNWTGGSVPGDDAVVMITADTTVEFGANATVGSIMIHGGATVNFFGVDGGRTIYTSAVSGDGTLVMKRCGFRATTDNAEISVARLEVPYYNTDWTDRDCWFEGNPQNGNSLIVSSPMYGDGRIKPRYNVKFTGDNSGVAGANSTIIVENYQTAVTFTSPEADFPNATTYAVESGDNIQSCILAFDNGTAKARPYDAYYVRDNATISLTAESGAFGFSVYTLAAGDSVSGATAGAGNLSIRKTGSGTVSLSIQNACNVAVEEGRAEFTSATDAIVNVAAGASVGGSGSVAALTFAEGAIVSQTYSEGATAVLTVTGTQCDVSNAVFAIVNETDFTASPAVCTLLSAVSPASLTGTPRSANNGAGHVAAGKKWKAVLRDGNVMLRPSCGMIIIFN